MILIVPKIIKCEKNLKITNNPYQVNVQGFFALKVQSCDKRMANLI